MDAVVVSTVLSTAEPNVGDLHRWRESRHSRSSPTYSCACPPLAAALPTADDQDRPEFETSGSSADDPLPDRRAIDEPGRACPMAPSHPGGSWHVLRCQIPASSPTRFLVGVSESGPATDRASCTVRIRPLDIPSVAGVGPGVRQERRHGGPLRTSRSAEPGWIDLEARVVAAERRACNAAGRSSRACRPSLRPQAEGEEGSRARPGDWNFYDARWEPARGAAITCTSPSASTRSLGSVRSPSSPRDTESSWNLLLR